MTIPKSALVDGTNVVAAETHLNYRGTPDALFRATLTAAPADPGTPAAAGQARPDGERDRRQTSMHLSWPDQADATGGFIVKRGDHPGGVDAASGVDVVRRHRADRRDDVHLHGDRGRRHRAADHVRSPKTVTTDHRPPAQGALVEPDATWRWRFASTAPDAGWKAVRRSTTRPGPRARVRSASAPRSRPPTSVSARRHRSRCRHSSGPRSTCPTSPRSATRRR